ncbi:hypothetical protein MASR2M66_19450 [Chloroflexota bacterium]
MAQRNKAGNKKGESAVEKLVPFLSYSKLDRAQVLEFSEKLKAEGWIDPWVDEEDILPGQVWESSVVTGVLNSHAVIIFLSKAAVTSEGYFHKEIKLALDTAAKKPEGIIFIIPIRLDDCKVPEMLKPYQYVSYFGSEERKEKVYASLILSLKLCAAYLHIKI